jgi:hypothetical protein
MHTHCPAANAQVLRGRGVPVGCRYVGRRGLVPDGGRIDSPMMRTFPVMAGAAPATMVSQIAGVEYVNLFGAWY